jgi:Holliday junction resolvase RusA-like endonuclease
MSFSVVIEGKAKPQGSKKAFVINGRAVLVEASKDLKTERLRMSVFIAANAISSKWQKIERPDGAIVTLEFSFVRPKSVKRQEMTVTPDVDKLTRFTLDAITQAGNIWDDDSQVVKLNVRKHYGDKDTTTISIDRIKNG